MALNTDELIELRNDILREMYAEAEPSLDFDKARENKEMDGDWYNDHYLPEDECLRIFKEHTEDVDLSDEEHASLSMTCLLDLSPTSSRD